VPGGILRGGDSDKLTGGSKQEAIPGCLNQLRHVVSDAFVTGGLDSIRIEVKFSCKVGPGFGCFPSTYPEKNPNVQTSSETIRLFVRL